MSEHCHLENGESRKTDIIKTAVSLVLLILVFCLDKLFEPSYAVRLAAYLVPYLISGFSVIKKAVKNISGGEIFDENFLMCIASIGAFIIGEFPEAVFVTVFFNIGEIFEETATEKSRHSVKALLDLRPDKATVITDGKEQRILCEEVKIGDTVKVVTGERIPLDGVLLSPTAVADNSAVTGESEPVYLKAGDATFSGCVNTGGTAEIRVTKSYGESTASKILSLVENSSEKKAKSERFIKKFAKIYTPAVCVAAVLIALIPSLIFGEPSKYIYRALAFLVVSCPCALVVSVPLAYFAGIASAAKKGILFKGAQYLEAFTKIGTAVFDKTGTVTKGKPEIIKIYPSGVTESELLKIAAAAEKDSTHPIAAAIKSAFKGGDIPLAEDLKEISGEGVVCLTDKKTTLAGNAALLKRYRVEFDEAKDTGTAVYIARDGVYLGCILLGDTPKNDAARVISRFNKRGIKTVMLTGDREAIAKKTAGAVQISEYRFGLNPEEKVAALEEYLNPESVTVFTGDGINDAPVLSRADVGVAMGALGSDAAVEAADVVLMRDTLSSLEDAMAVAVKTQKIAKQNIVFSLAVKLIILIVCGLGLGGYNMWLAALGDVGVLVIAVLNSLRALK